MTPLIIYTKNNDPLGGDVAEWLDDAPPWRKLRPTGDLLKPAPRLRSDFRGKSYVTSSDEEVLRVNMALLLRRPLLITGQPGIGKTTLAYHIASKLDLGEPLRWNITSQSTLKEGLYDYDAVGHLRGGDDLGKHITLGPLGTALLPWHKPRVLLVDELDKSSFDLPHDLLHVFEEGQFVIPELRRAGAAKTVQVSTADTDESPTVNVVGGLVHARHHPIIVITSNEEREFPEAFLRRCIQFRVGFDGAQERRDHIKRVATQHMGDYSDFDDRISDVLTLLDTPEHGEQATDVFLQIIYLKNRGQDASKLMSILSRKRTR